MPAKTAALKPAMIDAIRTVFDPEIPVNIWELGLIYDVFVDADGVAGRPDDADGARLSRRRSRCPSRSLRKGQGGSRRHRREGRRRLGTGVDQGSDVGRREAPARDVVGPRATCYRAKCRRALVQPVARRTCT